MGREGLKSIVFAKLFRDLANHSCKSFLSINFPIVVVSVSGEKYNQRWEFSVQAEDLGKSDQVWFLLLQTR